MTKSLLVVLTLVCAAPARAQDTAADTVPLNLQNPKTTRLDLTAGTTFPIAVNAALAVRLPQRVYFETALGWLPKAYIAAVNKVATHFDLYDDFQAQTIEESMKNGLAAQLGVGWQPFPKRGFELSLGYTLLWAKGRVEVPGLGAGFPDSAPVTTTMHSIVGMVGGRWVTHENMVIRAGLGWLHRVGVKTRTDSSGFEGVADFLIEAANDEIQRTLEEYGFTPLLMVHVGYRF